MSRKILTMDLAQLYEVHDYQVCEFCHFFDEIDRCEKKHRPKKYAMLNGPNEITHLRFKNKKCPDYKKYRLTKKEKEKLNNRNKELIEGRVNMMLAS